MIEAVIEIKIPTVEPNRVELSREDADVLLGLLAAAGTDLGVRIVLDQREAATDRLPEIVEPTDDAAAEHEESDPELWRCGEDGCDWTGESEDARREHKATVHGSGLIACDEPGCDFEAVNEQGLRSHKRKHDRADKTFPCEHPDCDFVGSSPSSLAGHSWVHKDDRPDPRKALNEEVQDRWVGRAKRAERGPSGRYANAESES